MTQPLFRRILILLLISLCFVSCDNKRGSEGLKKKAQTEYEAGLELEKERKRQISLGMEAELNRRKQLYEKVAGEFFVKVKHRLFEEEDRLYPITLRLIFTPQMPAPSTGRIREPSEIEGDLGTLRHWVQGVLKIDSSRFPYVEGCDFEVRHDLNTGQLYLKADQCNYFVSLYLSDGKPSASGAVLKNKSEALVKKALAGENINIDYLEGRAYFSQTGDSFALILKRQNHNGGGR